jgi:hypothetical protein
LNTAAPDVEPHKFKMVFGGNYSNPYISPRRSENGKGMLILNDQSFKILQHFQPFTIDKFFEKQNLTEDQKLFIGQVREKVN